MCAEIMPLLPDDVPAASILTTHRPQLDEITAACRDHYKILPDEFLTRTDRQASLARHLVVFEARRWLRTPYQELADYLHKKNHSTVSNYENKINGRIRVDEVLRDDIDIIERRLAYAVLERTGHGPAA